MALAWLKTPEDAAAGRESQTLAPRSSSSPSPVAAPEPEVKPSPEQSADEWIAKWKADAWAAEPTIEVRPEQITPERTLPEPTHPNRSLEDEGSRYYDRAKVAKAMSHNSRSVVCDKPIRARDVASNTADQKRNPLSTLGKREVIWRQGNKCIYCGRRFGSKVFERDGSARVLEVRFDHFEPYAFRKNNDKSNIFAACDICNGFKSDHVFDSLIAAREFITTKWEFEGISDHFQGALPFTADPLIIIAYFRNGGSRPCSRPAEALPELRKAA